ncbi:hypothetical protein J6590_020920 [Homalodisca vitripennis]|nr:hypothetical protein J6590_020920 [Homalodisca vitripennis]
MLDELEDMDDPDVLTRKDIKAESKRLVELYDNPRAMFEDQGLDAISTISSANINTFTCLPQKLHPPPKASGKSLIKGENNNGLKMQPCLGPICVAKLRITPSLHHTLADVPLELADCDVNESADCDVSESHVVGIEIYLITKKFIELYSGKDLIN